jgi:tetratricopeptide (TPR) repeat protein
MIEQWVQQLQSPDPQQRRQAIIALANSRDPAAIKPLAAVYQDDPVPELRDLALKAGRYIRQEAATEAPPQTALTVPPESGVEAAPAPGIVSKRDSELAQFYLDAATNYQTLGDRGRAIENLGKALSLHPARAKESFVANLILMATGMPADQAVPVLTHPDRREALIARAGGRRNLDQRDKNPGIEKATWDNVAIDFLIYWLVITICMASIFIMVLPELQDMFDETLATSPSSAQVDLDTLLAASALTLIIIAVFYGLVYTITLAIQGGAIHVVATFIFAGDNNLRYLYRRLVPFQTLVIFGFSAGTIILLLAGSGSDISYLVPLLMIAGAVGVAWYTAELIAKIYHFGWLSGCGTIVVAGILLAVLSCGVSSVLTSLMNALFGSGSAP